MLAYLNELYHKCAFSLCTVSNEITITLLDMDSSRQRTVTLFAMKLPPSTRSSRSFELTTRFGYFVHSYLQLNQIVSRPLEPQRWKATVPQLHRRLKNNRDKGLDCGVRQYQSADIQTYFTSILRPHDSVQGAINGVGYENHVNDKVGS